MMLAASLEWAGRGRPSHDVKLTIHQSVQPTNLVLWIGHHRGVAQERSVGSMRWCDTANPAHVNRSDTKRPKYQ